METSQTNPSTWKSTSSTTRTPPPAYEMQDLGPAVAAAPPSNLPVPATQPRPHAKRERCVGLKCRFITEAFGGTIKTPPNTSMKNSHHYSSTIMEPNTDSWKTDLCKAGTKYSSEQAPPAYKMQDFRSSSLQAVFPTPGPRQPQHTESVNWCGIAKALGCTVLVLAVGGAIIYGIMCGIVKVAETKQQHQRIPFW
ncbi:hypothetical protein KCU81_g3849, partial [Aureobasidium melanogenum]|uniref:Uncharacterized protein n=1 Tax=Aureobasidium melanogenum (strain CBS 110374) TaxID=1043003 RepID=A0A074VQ74_AURM1